MRLVFSAVLRLCFVGMRRQRRRLMDELYPAQHDAIVPKQLWDKTQHALAASAVIKKFDTSVN
jgi:hypothetical protein